MRCSGGRPRVVACRHRPFCCRTPGRRPGGSDSPLCESLLRPLFLRRLSHAPPSLVLYVGLRQSPQSGFFRPPPLLPPAFLGRLSRFPYFFASSLSRPGRGPGDRPVVSISRISAPLLFPTDRNCAQTPP